MTPERLNEIFKTIPEDANYRDAIAIYIIQKAKDMEEDIVRLKSDHQEMIDKMGHNDRALEARINDAIIEHDELLRGAEWICTTLKAMV